MNSAPVRCTRSRAASWARTRTSCPRWTRRWVSASCGGALPLNASSVWKTRMLVFDFRIDKMNITKTSQSKRPYRMSARADAANATAERLLEAAWRHFATRPYEQVRLREIAAEAGVTVQTLHLRFH